MHQKMVCIALIDKRCSGGGEFLILVSNLLRIIIHEIEHIVIMKHVTTTRSERPIVNFNATENGNAKEVKHEMIRINLSFNL